MIEGKVRILLVCMGNICRSPTAEGVLRRRLEQAGLDPVVEVDSAGTHGYHAGEAPDLRAQEAARRRGVDLSRIRARRVAPEDFERFDLILAMDGDNLESLRRACPEPLRAKLGRFLDYAEGMDLRDVPDPYYGGREGFERVLDMIENASDGLVATLRERAGPR